VPAHGELPMKVVLEVIEGPHRGRTFAFEGHDHFIVGRASCAHFRLPKQDPYFSRVHFMIEVNPPCCRLVDAGSTNGTRVNGQRVASADLQHGDLIQGGDTVLRVSLVREPDAAEELVLQGDPPVARRAKASAKLEDTRSCQPRLPVKPGPRRFDNRSLEETAPAVPGCRIVRPLGRGGMGIVYLAARSCDGLQVALKTIKPAFAGSDQDVQRFLREAGILRQLRHPHIVEFYEMGVAGELLYFAMEYVPGSDASQLLRTHGPLAVGRAVRLVCHVLEALQYAHGLGFVHRDIKPANLLVSGEPGFEVAKLADFGLARVYHASPLSGLTILGDVGGTLPYMPPEQITDFRRANPLSDQYATAATLYRLLTERYLFDWHLVPESQRLSKILLDPPVPIRARRPDIPEGLAQVIHRALEKDPSCRHADAAAFRDALLPFSGEH